MANGLPQADVEAIKVALQEGLDALESNDVEAWLAYWTEDAILMPTGVPAHQGHAQLREYHGHIGGKKYVLSDIRIDGRDDLAVVTTAVAIPLGGDTVGGKQILVLNKIAGRWLLAAVCFNMDVPGEM